MFKALWEPAAQQTKLLVKKVYSISLIKTLKPGFHMIVHDRWGSLGRRIEDDRSRSLGIAGHLRRCFHMIVFDRYKSSAIPSDRQRSWTIIWKPGLIHFLFRLDLTISWINISGLEWKMILRHLILLVCRRMGLHVDCSMLSQDECCQIIGVIAKDISLRRHEQERIR